VPPAPGSSPDPGRAGDGEGRPDRARVTELRLSAFAGHRRAALPFGPLT
jgi:hypothetical protein